jgi:hypothetical protein
MTQTPHNLDPNTVTIPFTAPPVAMAGSHCRVFLRGQNLCARTNLATRPYHTPHSLREPPAHRLSSLIRTFLRKSPRAGGRQASEPVPSLATHVNLSTCRRIRNTGQHGIIPRKDHRCPGFGTVLFPRNLVRIVRTF